MPSLRIREPPLLVPFLMASMCFGQVLIPESRKSPRASEHRRKGIEYGAEGKFTEAQHQFRQALKVDPFFLGVRDCLELTEDVLAKNTEKEVAIHLFRASIYGREGNWKDEIDESQKALAIDPDYPLTHASLGLSYGKKGMYSEAVEHLKKAIALDPNLATAHGNLGTVYVAKKMWDEAIDQLKRALAIEPKMADCYNNIGTAYLGKNMPSKMIPPCKKAIDINPDFAGAHNNLALGYYYTGQYDLAVKHCDKAIELGAPVHPGFLKALKPYRK